MMGGCLVWYGGKEGNDMGHVWRDYVCAFFLIFTPSLAGLGPRPEVPSCRSREDVRNTGFLENTLGSSSGLTRPRPPGTGMPCVLCRHLWTD